MSKRIILLPGAYTSPPARYRIRQFYKPFKELGYEVKMYTPFPDRGNKFPEKFSFLDFLPSRLKQLLRLFSMLNRLNQVRFGDIVISNRDIVPELRITFFEELIKKKGAKLIIDYDDAVFLGKRKSKFVKILSIADVAVSGNQYLFDFSKDINSNSFIIPTVVDTKYFSFQKKITKRNTKVTVGWIGSASTRVKHLPLLKPIIEKLSKHHEFSFLIIADSNPNLNWNHSDIQFIQWSKELEVESLKKIDIGLMPLTDDEHDKGKCGFKAIQYMSLGIPAIVSPVGVNKEIVTDYKDGLYAKDVSQWVEKIGFLIRNSDSRNKMGIAAREKVEKMYSLEKAIDKWIEIFKKL